MSWPASGTPAFELEGVSVAYGGHLAIEDVDVAIPSGRMTAVVGPNGAGKSTLVKAAIGRVRTLSGTVRVLGGPVAQATRRVAYVPQRRDVDLDFPITVGEVVMMGRHAERGWLRRTRGEDRAIVADAMRRLGIEELRGRPIGELSGGQLQRTIVARAVAQRRELLVLDEPFVGIDVATERELRALLRELVDAGHTVVVVDHDLAGVREHYDHAVLMDGRIAAAGPPAEVLADDMLLETFAGIATR